MYYATRISQGKQRTSNKSYHMPSKVGGGGAAHQISTNITQKHIYVCCRIHVDINRERGRDRERAKKDYID